MTLYLPIRPANLPGGTGGATAGDPESQLGVAGGTAPVDVNLPRRMAGGTTGGGPECPLGAAVAGLGEHRQPSCAGGRLPTGRPAPAGVIRGWRYRGKHALPIGLGDLALMLLSALVLVGAAVGLSPRIADAAGTGIPDRPPQLQVQKGTPRGIMATAQQWAHLFEARDHAGQYDLWTADAQAGTSKQDYLAAVACQPPRPEILTVRNVRVDRAIVDGDSAVIWYYGESFRPFGPVRFHATTWHLYHVLYYERGAWRHVPYESVDGSPVVEPSAARAAC